jgi:hypothetical protein
VSKHTFFIFYHICVTFIEEIVYEFYQKLCVCVWATKTVYNVDFGYGIFIWQRDFITVHRSTVLHTEVWFLSIRGLKIQR